MKKFKVNVSNRSFIVVARDSSQAVTKLKDAQSRRLSDALGVGKCAPTSSDFAREAKQLLSAYNGTKKTDVGSKTFVSMVKNLESDILKKEEEVSEFDNYWVGHKKEILENLRIAKVTLTQARIKLSDSAIFMNEKYAENNRA